MKLTVLNSGSSGNGYLLEARNSALLLECGVPPKELFRLSKCPVSKIAGCLVTHEHLDHAKYTERYAQLGLPIFASRGTLDSLRERKAQRGRYFPSGTFRPLTAMHTRVIGDWTVSPFDVVHDAVEPLGFIVHHRECGRIMFITDTSFCKYDFRGLGLDHIMVEANYDDGLLNGNVVSGLVDPGRAERTRSNHMSIRQACDLIRANMTAELKTVVLLHLSGDNADAASFARKAEETALFARIAVAAKGFTIQLSKNENTAVL